MGCRSKVLSHCIDGNLLDSRTRFLLEIFNAIPCTPKPMAKSCTPYYDCNNQYTHWYSAIGRMGEYVWWILWPDPIRESISGMDIGRKQPVFRLWISDGLGFRNSRVSSQLSLLSLGYQTHQWTSPSRHYWKAAIFGQVIFSACKIANCMDSSGDTPTKSLKRVHLIFNLAFWLPFWIRRSTLR